MKFIGAAFIFSLLVAAGTKTHAFGATEDIPFSLSGMLVFHHIATGRTAACKVVMAGRTGAKNKPARITASQYFGDTRLCAAGAGIHIAPYTWDLDRFPGSIYDLKLSSIFFDHIVGPCTGDMKLTWMGENKYAVLRQAVDAAGACTVTGSLKRVQDSADFIR
jgi:hypothetical protein